MTLRRRIERLCDEWRPIMALDHWRVELRYNERENVATCRAYPNYEDAILAFNLRRIQTDAMHEAPRGRVPDRWLEELVVHELCHCLVWRSSERTVTRLARAFLRLKYRQRSRKAGR